MRRWQRTCHREAARGVSNLRFESGDLSLCGQYGTPSAISIIDVLHYFDFETQESILTQACRLLPSGGVLIFREVDPDGGWVSKWNRLYEKLMTGIGFTRSKEVNLFFRSREDWLEIMNRAGFRARAERCSHFLFADVLFIGEKENP
jgi:O-methyltransferase involved in polyketide biosynthesis